MEAYLQHLLTQSVQFTLMVVFIVTFLESLAVVGLVLPGTVMMTSVGALIGSGQVGFYPAWAAAFAGCFIGDWLSYFLGRAFKQPLHNWSFLKKHQGLLDKTEYALHQHSMATVLIGRFVGPTRPLVPMVAGMLDLPRLKFALPNIIGCITWPPVYLFPGILAGVAIEIPHSADSTLFKWLLVGVAFVLWLAGWLSYRWYREGKRPADRLSRWLPVTRLRWLAPLMIMGALGSVVILLQQPLMPVYRHLLWHVLSTQ